MGNSPTIREPRDLQERNNNLPGSLSQRKRTWKGVGDENKKDDGDIAPL